MSVLEPSVLESVTTRLKRSKHDGDVEAIATGKKHGRQWAIHAATQRELYRLECADAPECAEDLAYIIGRENSWDFCHEAFDTDALHAMWDSTMVSGFVRGALEVWKQVRPSVET